MTLSFSCYCENIFCKWKSGIVTCKNVSKFAIFKSSQSSLVVSRRCQWKVQIFQGSTKKTTIIFKKLLFFCCMQHTGSTGSNVYIHSHHTAQPISPVLIKSLLLYYFILWYYCKTESTETETKWQIWPYWRLQASITFWTAMTVDWSFWPVIRFLSTMQCAMSTPLPANNTTQNTSLFVTVHGVHSLVGHRQWRLATADDHSWCYCKKYPKITTTISQKYLNICEPNCSFI